MNILVTITLLVMAIIALQYSAWVLFGALVLAAIVSSPRAWIYTLAASLIMFALRYFSFPSWEVFSFLVIGIAYALMSNLEARRENEEENIPPELLAYMMMGGLRRAP